MTETRWSRWRSDGDIWYATRCRNLTPAEVRAQLPATVFALSLDGLERAIADENIRSDEAEIRFGRAKVRTP